MGPVPLREEHSLTLLLHRAHPGPNLKSHGMWCQFLKLQRNTTTITSRILYTVPRHRPLHHPHLPLAMKAHPPHLAPLRRNSRNVGVHVPDGGTFRCHRSTRNRRRIDLHKVSLDRFNHNLPIMQGAIQLNPKAIRHHFEGFFGERKLVA